MSRDTCENAISVKACFDRHGKIRSCPCADYSPSARALLSKIAKESGYEIREVEMETVAKRVTEKLGQFSKKFPEMCAKASKKFEEQMKLYDWDKPKEVDTGEKKYKVGDIVKVGRIGEPMRKGIVVEEWPDPDKQYRVYIPLPNSTGACWNVNADALVSDSPEPKLSGEELGRLMEDICKEHSATGDCAKCPLGRIMQWECDMDTATRLLANYDEIVDILTAYKAQKEQEKEEKPVKLERVKLARIIKGSPGDVSSEKEVVAELIHQGDTWGTEAKEVAHRWFNEWCKDHGGNYFMTGPEFITRVKQD